MLLHIKCVRDTPTLHVLYHTYNTIRLHTLCCTCFSIRTKKYKLLKIHQTVHAVQYMPSYTYHTAHNILIVLTIRSLLHILRFTLLDCLYYTTQRYYAYIVLYSAYYTIHSLLVTPYYTAHATLYNQTSPYCTLDLLDYTYSTLHIHFTLLS